MIALSLTESGSVLRRESESFVVTHDIDPDGSGPLPEVRRTLLEIEPHKVSWIALLGGVHMTREAAALCLDWGIPVAFLTASGRFWGRLSPVRAGGVRLGPAEGADRMGAPVAPSAARRRRRGAGSVRPGAVG